MQAWQQRVVDEAADLKSKIGKLTAFLETNQCSAEDAVFLVEQRVHMRRYLQVLNSRIAKFG